MNADKLFSELEDECKKLILLLENPERGLMSWNMMTAERMKKVRSKINALIPSKKDI